MKKLANRYRYERYFEEKNNDNKISWSYHNGDLYACYKKRDYKTKMKVDDLPEHYCDVVRYSSCHDVVSAKNIKGLYYKWFKENHFMKDSVLYVSYSDKIEPYHEIYTFKGKEFESIFYSYKNADELIFGYSIFKFLAYAHKYSNYDLSEIKNEIKKQCKWLKENEPLHVPDLTGFKDYGEWFDDMIKKSFDYDY